MRIDKMSLAATAATLLHYLKDEALQNIPVWRSISASKDEIRQRASKWRDAIGGDAKVVPAKSTIGGGSLPGEILDSWAVAIPCDHTQKGAQGLARRLREQATPVISRIENEQVIMDPRTVLPQEDNLLIAAVQGALSEVA